MHDYQYRLVVEGIQKLQEEYFFHSQEQVKNNNHTILFGYGLNENVIQSR